MKPLYLLTVISTGLLCVTGCTQTINEPTSNPTVSEQSQPTQTQSKKKRKNPLRVSFYTRAIPHVPYTIIGEESISKFNQGGIKRQEAHLRDSMRELAAAMGGDAVINIKSNSKSISGTVVAFEKNTHSHIENGAVKNQG